MQVTMQDLLLTIGEQTVELGILRKQNEQLVAEVATLKKVTETNNKREKVEASA